MCYICLETVQRLSSFPFTVKLRMLREFPDGRAVVLDSSGTVLRQLVKFERTKSGKTKFSCNFAVLSYPIKKDALRACRQMGIPHNHIKKGQSLMGSFWYIVYDFRTDYAIGCWKI